MAHEARAIIDSVTSEVQAAINLGIGIKNQISAIPTVSSSSLTTLANMISEDPVLPYRLKLFLNALLHGETCLSPEKEFDLRIESLTADSVFCTSRGAVRPLKHQILGMGLSSITGSKTAISILNRLGHSLSYNNVKRLETDFCYTFRVSGQSVPDGILLDSSSCAGLAWDNYDANTDSLDGKNSLYTTVSIIYQNKGDIIQETTASQGNDSFSNSRLRVELEPYRKLLKQARFDTLSRNTEEDGSVYVGQHILDFFYLTRVVTSSPQPLHQGFNSYYHVDDLPQHRIAYKDQIFSSPTKNEVVKETLVQTLRCVSEVGQKYIIVSCDLVIALKAYSIQKLESRMFDDILILFGNFHIELSFFGAIGTFIHESGFTDIFVEAGIPGPETYTGFVKGKYYNRYTRGLVSTRLLP